MANVDKKWERMLQDAVNFQQKMYEQLPDWSVLDGNESDYLKEYIEIAVYGISHVSAKVPLTTKQRKQIDMICETIKTNCTDTNKRIYFGIIYVVTFRCKSNKPTEEGNISHVPVFKTRIGENENTYTTGYIDTKCRVYESWNNFLDTNELPCSTMVYPRDGYYQPNPESEVTEDYSEPWICYQDSPAANKTVTNVVDVASSVLTVGSSIVAIAAAFTPVAPVVLIGGAVSGGASGIWSFARNVSSQVDRYKHKQSIGLNDRESISNWIGMAGASTSVGVAGGAALISKAAEKGANISKLGTVAYNTVLAGEISTHAVGIGFHAYNIGSRYLEDETIEYVNVALLVTNVLFFGNSVLNVKTASDLIKSTQGGIIEAYGKSLSKKRYRKSFNRIKNKSYANCNSETEAQNEIIRRINRLTSTKDVLDKISKNTTLKNVSRPLNAQNKYGGLRLNGIELLDITFYIKDYIKPILLNCGAILVKSYITTGARTNFDTENVYVELRHILTGLLSEIVPSRNRASAIPCTNAPNINMFRRILDDMKNLTCSIEILPTLFNIARLLIENEGSLEILLADALEVLWHYIIESAENYTTRACIALCPENLRGIILDINIVLFREVDVIGHDMISAFKQYLCDRNSSPA